MRRHRHSCPRQPCADSEDGSAGAGSGQLGLSKPSCSRTPKKLAIETQAAAAMHGISNYGSEEFGKENSKGTDRLREVPLSRFQ